MTATGSVRLTATIMLLTAVVFVPLTFSQEPGKQQETDAVLSVSVSQETPTVAPAGSKTPISYDQRNGRARNEESGLSRAVSVFGATAFIVGIILVCALLLRVSRRRGTASGSERLIEILDRRTVDSKSELVVVSWCGKTTLAAHVFGGAWTALGETDAQAPANESERNDDNIRTERTDADANV